MPRKVAKYAKNKDRREKKSLMIFFFAYFASLRENFYLCWLVTILKMKKNGKKKQGIQKIAEFPASELPASGSLGMFSAVHKTAPPLNKSTNIQKKKLFINPHPHLPIRSNHSTVHSL